MGSNQSQPGRHHHRTYSRAPTTTYSDMSTIARHKKGSARILLERKCRFLGRFYAKEISEANLSRLRNHIRLIKGQKTKLRLTQDGIASGSKFGTIFKNKLPSEFTPLKDIIDIFTDDRFRNILCIAMKFPDGNYEIQAYRMYNDAMAREFQYAYSNVYDRFSSGDHTTHNPGVHHVYSDHNISGHWSNADNWTFKDEGHHGEPAARKNGLRKTTSLYNALDAGETRGGRSLSPTWVASKDDNVTSMGFTSAKGNIGKKLTDVSARDMDLYPADDDSFSQGSGDSNEELRWRLHNLSREVNTLKASMDDKHNTSARRHNTSTMNGFVPREDGRSKHYVLTHHRDLDDRWSDDGSDVSGGDRVDGRLVDSRAGVVKASVSDYRPGGNTNQSNSHGGYHSGTASSKIGQARRANGHINRLPDGEIIRQEKAYALKVNNDPNHLVYVDEVQDARKAALGTWTEPRGRHNHAGEAYRARAHSRARSADGGAGTYRSMSASRMSHAHRAPSEISFNGGGNNTLATARVSRPVDRIYLPTGGGNGDYYVINPRATSPGKSPKYAHSVIGAPRYDHKNRRQ